MGIIGPIMSKFNWCRNSIRLYWSRFVTISSGSKVIDNSDIFQYKFMVLPLRNNRYKTGILGMFAIRSRRKVATEKDFLEAVNKVIKAYAKFSSTPKYMTYN